MVEEAGIRPAAVQVEAAAAEEVEVGVPEVGAVAAEVQEGAEVVEVVEVVEAEVEGAGVAGDRVGELHRGPRLPPPLPV